MLAFLKSSLQFKKIAMQMYRKDYPYLFYGSAITFSFIHFENYNWTVYNFPHGVISGIGEIFLPGLFLGYLCIRYGIFYAILFHIASNAIALVEFYYIPVQGFAVTFSALLVSLFS